MSEGPAIGIGKFFFFSLFLHFFFSRTHFFSFPRNRPWHHLLVRWCLAERPRRDHLERPGIIFFSFLAGK